jgi:cobalt transporter subunit CbtA
MAEFRALFLVAALAGLIAGAFITAVHQFSTVPIILMAEVLEKIGEAGSSASTMSPAPAGDDHDHTAAARAPRDGLERTAYTLVADVLTGVGFALLLVSGYALLGGGVGWRRGLFWGLAGFATFTLAPGIGLPAEVPGTLAAPLFDRQVWWVLTALATGGGLALIFLVRSALWSMTGVILLLLPHVYGAPRPAELKSVAPESLAHSFIVSASISSFLFWIVIGTMSGPIYEVFRGKA